MTRPTMAPDELCALLTGMPVRLAELAAGMSPAARRERPEPDEWSANEVLAHLRACADLWGEASRPGTGGQVRQIRVASAWL